jgi:hypothetical protein
MKFAWTHVTLLIIVSQTFLILQNLFNGIIWFVRGSWFYFYFSFHPQVSCARLNDHLLRHNELHVWLLLGPNSANQVIAEEDLGGLYWGRI